MTGICTSRKTTSGRSRRIAWSASTALAHSPDDLERAGLLERARASSARVRLVVHDERPDHAAPPAAGGAP